MRPVPVVAVQPSRQLSGSAIGMGVGLSVSPFAQCALDEAFGLAVGLWGVGPGSDVLEAEFAAGVAEVEGFVAGAVVGHDAGDVDAQASVVGHCGVEEGDGAFLFLVGHDLGEGDARGVVDADMDELPAEALAATTPVALAAAIAGDPWPMPSIRPSFLMSMWISSPGCSRS